MTAEVPKPKLPDPAAHAAALPDNFAVVDHMPASAMLVFLVVGIAVGIATYYLLTHVMIEDGDNA